MCAWVNVCVYVCVCACVCVCVRVCVCRCVKCVCTKASRLLYTLGQTGSLLTLNLLRLLEGKKVGALSHASHAKGQQEEGGEAHATRDLMAQYEVTAFSAL